MIVKLLQTNRGTFANKETATYVFPNVESYTLIENENQGSQLVIKMGGEETIFSGGIFDRAYVMNDNGKTIDTIILIKPKELNIKQEDFAILKEEENILAQGIK